MYLSPTHIHTHSHTLTVTLPGSVVRCGTLQRPPAAVWSLWVGRSVVLFCCTFCLCLPVVGVKGGSDTRSRVMDRGMRKRESDIETHRGRGREPGVSFVASAVKAQQGEPPWQFVSGAMLSFFFFFPSKSALLLAPRCHLQQIKKAARQKLYSDTQPADTPDLPSMPLAFSASSSFSYSRSNLKICSNYIH